MGYESTTTSSAVEKIVSRGSTTDHYNEFLLLQALRTKKYDSKGIIYVRTLNLWSLGELLEKNTTSVEASWRWRAGRANECISAAWPPQWQNYKVFSRRFLRGNHTDRTISQLNKAVERKQTNEQTASGEASRQARALTTVMATRFVRNAFQLIHYVWLIVHIE